MNECTVCKKQSGKTGEYEFYYGKNISNSTSGGYSGLTHITTTTTNYAVNPETVKGHVCTSCLFKSILRYYGLASIAFIIYLLGPALIIGIMALSAIIPFEGLREFLVTVCALLIGLWCMYIFWEIWNHPIKTLKSIFGPIFSFLVKSEREHNGDQALIWVSSDDLLKQGNDTFFTRREYRQLTGSSD